MWGKGRNTHNIGPYIIKKRYKGQAARGVTSFLFAGKPTDILRKWHHRETEYMHMCIPLSLT